jgi:hypothetical protein
MTYKQSIQTNKHWTHSGHAAFSPTNLIAKLLTIVKIEIPVGYQDESGFHHGAKSVSKRVK